MNSLNDALVEDAERMEELCIHLGEMSRARKVQDTQYWIALAVYHILQWILRRRGKW